ncbi:hypothetical protein EV421DRAFT_2035991 [Armillaria borealis]|uniref:Uncharacterized protein n=1 Tax=Armillaria borealis TaxID=47425 RepID=A0AA39JKJ2_9AGAR|nr:hypothetical protein EV421DRAFT_2035991 [Armillaria borealis]
MTSKANILLLREPMLCSDSGKDRNDATFLDSITALGDFDGIITTDAHSYEALDRVNGTGNNESPFYVVGKATASILRSVMPTSASVDNLRG